MTRSRSTGFGSDSATRPPGSTGWGGGNDLQSKQPAPQAKNGSSYSFIKTSPGYVDHVVTQVRKFLAPFEGTLADLFVENPQTDKQKKARAHFLKLDQNERGALQEFYEKEKGRYDVC